LPRGTRKGGGETHPGYFPRKGASVSNPRRKRFIGVGGGVPGDLGGKVGRRKG